MLTKEEIKELLKDIETCDYSNLNYEFEQTGPKNFVVIGYRYPDFIHKLPYVLEPDYKYTENVKPIFNKSIKFEEMNLNQLSTVMTYFLRRERFVEGTLACALKDGSLAKVLKRYLELI